MQIFSVFTEAESDKQVQKAPSSVASDTRIIQTRRNNRRSEAPNRPFTTLTKAA